MDSAPRLSSPSRSARPTADPVWLYLEQLSPSSRRVMRACLEVIADCLSGGKHSAQTFPWHKASYAQAARLSTWLQRTYAPSSVARHLCAWRGVLRESWRLGMDSDRFLRATSVRAPKGGPRQRSPLMQVDEIAALLAIPNPSPWDLRDVAIVAVLAGTGLRRAELCACDLCDVDLDTGALTVRSGKGGRGRECHHPLPSSSLCAALGRPAG